MSAREPGADPAGADEHVSLDGAVGRGVPRVDNALQAGDDAVGERERAIACVPCRTQKRAAVDLRMANLDVTRRIVSVLALTELDVIERDIVACRAVGNQPSERLDRMPISVHDRAR